MKGILRLFALLAAVGALGLACGGSGAAHAHGQSTAQPSAVAVATRLLLQFSACVRQHGVPDFPDPVLDAQGSPDYPSGTPRIDELPQPALEACEQILASLPPSPWVTRSAQDVARLRLFARCLRQQGITDWPDPDAQGRFHVPPDLQNIKTGPRAAAIQAAMRGACATYLPATSFQIVPA